MSRNDQGRIYTSSYKWHRSESGRSILLEYIHSGCWEKSGTNFWRPLTRCINLKYFVSSFARLSKWWLAPWAYDEALVEVLADNDLDLSNLSEESDFYESSDPEESSEEKIPDKKVEDLPDEREEPQQNPVDRELNVE